MVKAKGEPKRKLLPGTWYIISWYRTWCRAVQIITNALVPFYLITYQLPCLGGITFLDRIFF